MALEREHLWQLATVWIKSNRMLIYCVASHHIPHMGYSSQDLESEALLVAYQTLSRLVEDGKDLSLMGCYFRVVFRSRCIELTRGIKVITDCDVERITIVPEETFGDKELDKRVIDATLMSLTERQRQVAKWILSQPTPVDTSLIGKHFGITTRGVRRLINCAINRIENGHRKVCRELSVTT